MRDFVFGVEVQQTRTGALTLGFEIDDPSHLVTLRERYFEAFDPEEKAQLRAELAAAEDDLIERVFARAFENAQAATRARTREAREHGEAVLEQLPYLRERFASRDRVFPAFLPAFHAPDVARAGGWHIVIMNPPYVGRTQLAERFDTSYRADLTRHYGRTYDLMIHFGKRAFEFSRRGGVVSMIFNDSIFTSADAADFRLQLLTADGEITLLTVARTRCFEGTAINGGVVVAITEMLSDPPVRYIENHGRPSTELAGASVPSGVAIGRQAIGQSELWIGDRSHYLRLPHRPLFRPSAEAISLIGRYLECAAWSELNVDWDLLSETRRLERWKDEHRRAGFYERLRENRRFILLGLVIDGGVGLQTSDDRRFLAAIEGTAEAARAVANRTRLEALVLARSEPARLYYERLARGRTTAEALLDVAEQHTDRELGWPKTGLVRAASVEAVRTTRLSREEIADGVAEGPIFVPFEKGDDSGDEGAARWRRDNPIVIDWSSGSVALLRQRGAQAQSYRKPRLQNEHLWGQGGVAWNAVGRYLRARLAPDGTLFGHGSPVIRPHVDWLSIEALLALLNAPALDFALRTLLSSLMNIHVGDLRRLPIPVLADEQSERLTSLGRCALAEKEAIDRTGAAGRGLSEIETELDAYTRDLYGIPRDGDFWVVR